MNGPIVCVGNGDTMICLKATARGQNVGIPLQIRYLDCVRSFCESLLDGCSNGHSFNFAPYEMVQYLYPIPHRDDDDAAPKRVER
jgi:hypothetical protein